MEGGMGVIHLFHRCVTGSEFTISRIRQVFIEAFQYFGIRLSGEKCNLLYTWRFLRCLRYIFKSKCLVFRGVNLLVASELVKFSPTQTEGSCIGLPACISPPLPPYGRAGERTLMSKNFLATTGFQFLQQWASAVRTSRTACILSIFFIL